MIVPEAPALAERDYITPTIYEAALVCHAKATWCAFGQRGVIPEHPAALLGTCFHAVVAAAHIGALDDDDDSAQTTARHRFDESAQSLYDEAHALLRLKFPCIERLPYYNMHRERAVLHASRIALSRQHGASAEARAASAASQGGRTEVRLCSQDGKIVGRPDHFDRGASAVVDYKTGRVDDTDETMVSEAEARQLRLYAYLGIQNDISVSTGVIVRRSGQRSELSISLADACTEADRAREQLSAFNSGVRSASSFADISSPSPEACRMCPCIAFCEAFWNAVNLEWTKTCGLHVEGEIAEIAETQLYGVALITMMLSPRRGNLQVEQVAVEQIPKQWLTLEGQAAPEVGDLVRLIHGRQSDSDETSAVIRADKTLTSIWRVPSDTGAES